MYARFTGVVQEEHPLDALNINSRECPKRSVTFYRSKEYEFTISLKKRVLIAEGDINGALDFHTYQVAQEFAHILYGDIREKLRELEELVYMGGYSDAYYLKLIGEIRDETY